MGINQFIHQLFAYVYMLFRGPDYFTFKKVMARDGFLKHLMKPKHNYIIYYNK